MNMAVRRWAWHAVAIGIWGAVVAPGSGAEEFDPYEIPQEQFQARVHTVALKPFGVPWDTANNDAVRQTFETLITEGLRAKGYTVVSSAEYEKVWQQMSERLGGTFDTVTGEARKAEYDAAREHSGRELARLHGVDAILEAFIYIDDAPFGGFFAYSTWDESLRWQGRTIPVATWTRPQKVFGAHLNVVIRDLAGTKLYGIACGIEWTAVYAARGYEEKAPHLLYDEPDRNRRAVDIDLRPLIPAAKRS